MADRTVVDSAGRTWTCAAPAGAENGQAQGQDVVLTCRTPSVGDPIRITVGWRWESMAENGLARLINLKSPVPRK